MTELEVRDLFGYNLKRIRKLRNVSQMQLADKVDMHFTFINAIENGKKWVSPESIAKFTEALEIEAYQFFLPKDYKLEDSPDIVSFAKDLSENFQLIKSRYGLR
ncbi:helix-turn-helix transcriptional regulator [Treponema sp.]|uniref:helix-turn-helix domain-containing protein n=1 Tax=Treponema sp. TaxID=166 RepID=UPI0025EA77D2|nr:helix-turn-helix transcriptional regulator [Treponema sp.]MBQ8012797.1 helix-turn-helix transcriptional regulator [Treponema sp.]MBR4321650.1 helix-turn-helix transcriptional regulator [Treponema sp.]MBR4598520.1 helix-turn-helix transcriptional regulator [Treponema sp.]